ncbi:MAG: serine hydrolase [candidate division Zixibacteria bacterium]|nr:beta-lactamase family protein [candidate division Zixibacteria bacterium]NIW41665.1 serine hydrolase [candidate division Zixibacteria bacterium]NIX55258.1 serine hydrolase [candidate division Zixibacteria bacterium]
MRSSVSTAAILLFCILAMPVVAQVSEGDIPETPSGKLLELLLKSFNSGDEEAWKDFIANNWKESDDPQSAERRLGFFRQVYDDTEGLELQNVTDSDSLTISALLHARKPEAGVEWVDLTLFVDSTNTDKLLMISARPGEDPRYEVPEGKLSHVEMADFLDAYLKDLVAEDQFSGTVLIALDGEPFYTRFYGEACKRYNVPNKLDTKFNLGSMNKMFTGTAIMQLVEQGKISLEDKVGKYLPDIPGKEIAEKVTIHQLLTHTSGMQDYWDEMFDTSFWELKTVDGLASLIFEDTLLFEPGSEFHYSNSGPIVLGMIIEKVSGTSYYDYVDENIYKPAGMINSGCFEVDTPVPNLAIGYTHMNYDGSMLPEDVRHNNLFMHAVKGGPAGGGYSTVEDLLAFDQALRNGKLMSRESFDLMSTGKTSRRPDESYAYLIQDQNINGHRIVGHGGGAPGINAMLDMYMDSGYTVAVMANYDGAASRVAEKIRELLTK